MICIEGKTTARIYDPTRFADESFKAPPSWYTRYLRPARFLGVAPWELMERVEVYGEEAWLWWAAVAEAAEEEAREIIRKRNAQK